MRRSVAWLAVFALVGLPAVLAAADQTASPVHWEIKGDFSEACTCAVPCACNFGQGPSPHHYCHSIFSFSIESGHYGTLTLDGLHLAGVHGEKSKVWYIDGRATPEQAKALEAIAARLSREAYQYATAEITQKVGESGNYLEIAGAGGFEADYIIGMDGKTPVVVENNTAWRIPRAIKGKTKYMRYKDKYGNKFDEEATNSNEGKFDWKDTSAPYMY